MTTTTTTTTTKATTAETTTKITRTEFRDKPLQRIADHGKGVEVVHERPLSRREHRHRKTASSTNQNTSTKPARRRCAVSVRAKRIHPSDNSILGKSARTTLLVHDLSSWFLTGGAVKDGLMCKYSQSSQYLSPSTF